MQKRRAPTLVVVLAVALLLTSCGAAEKAADVTGYAEAPAAAPQDDVAKAPQEVASTYGAGSTQALPSVGQRMIIRNVDVAIVVEDTEETFDQLQDMVQAFDGYIASSRRWYSNEQLYASVTLRVPADSLDAVMDRIHDAAIRVERESSTGEDVTEEYADLGARLRNLEATEEELRALLTEVRENQGDAEEILAIYRRLTEIRGEIESLKGRQQYLEQMTALATIQLEIRPKEAPRSVIEAASWSPLITASNALRALINLTKTLVDVAIYVVFFSPLILIPALVLWLIARLIKSRQRRRQAG
jgi:uncharacterized protein Yka (UPF0111/DUF47 family)